MSSIDVAGLLTDVSPDSPCGEDLSYDPEFLDLENMVKGNAERQVGEEVVEAEEPNWRDVRDRCAALLSRSKNLRVATWLALALLRTDGVGGLRDGLSLLKGLLEQYWDHVHPRLDPDDGNDPLERMNIIASLSPPPGSYQDPMRFRERLASVPLCRSQRIGSFGLRDILVATGESPAPEGEEGSGPELAAIDAAFEDTPTEELKVTEQALEESHETVAAIDAYLTGLVGPGAAPSLESFEREIKQALDQVRKYLDRRGYGAGESAGEAAYASGAPTMVSSGEIRSKQDVLRVFDKVCEYYASNEPSSPVPLLVRRARRLVGKSFVDIIKDISPDAMDQVERVGGVQSEGSSEESENL